jgi:hypothetical protein
MAETEPVQHLAHGALVKRNAKSRRDHVAKIDTPPAHHAIIRDIATLLHDLGKFGPLLCCQSGRRSRSLAVDKSVDA